MFRYLSLPCPKIYDDQNLKWNSVSDCDKSGKCKLSHNEFEIWYHPKEYKKFLCPFLDSCEWNDFGLCSHKHSNDSKND